MGVRPDYVLTRIEDVVVAKGIVVEDFSGAGGRYEVVARQLSNGNGASVAVEILGLDGTRHYTATVVLGEGHASPASVRQPSTPAVRGVGADAFYAHHAVFHGPAFQVIKDVDAGPEGMVATLDGTLDRGWSGGAWTTDPALLDGALQLALYFTSEALSQKSLPTGIASVHVYRSLPESSTVKGILTGRVESHRSVTDVLLTTADGAPVVELRGVSTFGYGDKQASTRNPGARA